MIGCVVGPMLWLVCGYFATGLMAKDWLVEFPRDTWNEQRKNVRALTGIGFLGGPLALAVGLVVTGFGADGFLWDWWLYWGRKHDE
jgi:hypothetical protein